MHPLDVAVYGPLKGHPGRNVNQGDIAKMFAPAYLKAASAKNASSGFEASGLWPFNQHVFGEHDFAPAYVGLTGKPDRLNCLAADSEARPTILELALAPLQTHRPTPNPGLIDGADVTPTTAVTQLVSTVTTTEPSATTPGPSGAKPGTCKSPNETRPLPTIINTTKRKRQSQKAEVLTSTQIKLLQKEKQGKQMSKIPRFHEKPGRPEKLNFESEVGPTSKNKKFFCQICGESYEEPPQEDWIQYYETCRALSPH